MPAENIRTAFAAGIKQRSSPAAAPKAGDGAADERVFSDRQKNYRMRGMTYEKEI